MNVVIDVTTTTKPYRQEALVPPRGAAIAGVISSLLTIVGLGLVRYAVPADPSLPGIWLTEPTHRNAVRLALDSVPFAGTAFLWFIGLLLIRFGRPAAPAFAPLLLSTHFLTLLSPSFCCA